MLFETEEVGREEFERATGWSLRPEGACRGDICVPLGDTTVGDRVNVAQVADKLGMPIARHGDLGALGPATFGGHALTTAEAPELVLPDMDGQPFDLRSLRGKKVVVVAWSPY